MDQHFDRILKVNQKEVITEALRKKLTSGGLALPLGFGKTRTSICLGLKYKCGPILVVMSKTLIANWIPEIEKAFGELLKYEIVHSEYLKEKFGTWTPHPDTQLVITTPDVLSQAYKDYHLDALFLNYIVPDHFGPTILEYRTPSAHMLDGFAGPGYIFSVDWGCLIIDEIQAHTNILTDKCRAISCISSKYRWGLSGTMFDEPKMERFLGYFILLNLKGPRTLPDIKKFIRGPFMGFSQYLIHRKENTEFKTKPKYHEEVISHTLSPTELKIFEMSRAILSVLNIEVRKKKELEDKDGVRKFSAYMLAMITYIRQFIISPLIPITSIYCDIADFEEKSQLSKIISDQFRELKLDEWLDNEKSLVSTRFSEMIKKIEKHKDERILVFSCFRSSITLFQHILDERGYDTLTITANMSANARQGVLEKFEESEKSILLLPYSLGAEGLNLQTASVVLLMDLWWNSAKIQQAIGRVFRPGQKALNIYVYLFVSNTSMEKTLIDKNKIKEEMLAELQHGKLTKKLPKMSMKEIIEIITDGVNTESLKSIRKYAW